MLFSQERTPSGWDRGVPVPERTLAGHTAAKGAFGLFTASQIRDKDGGAVQERAGNGMEGLCTTRRLSPHQRQVSGHG